MRSLKSDGQASKCSWKWSTLRSSPVASAPSPRAKYTSFCSRMDLYGLTLPLAFVKLLLRLKTSHQNCPILTLYSSLQSLKLTSLALKSSSIYVYLTEFALCSSKVGGGKTDGSISFRKQASHREGPNTRCCDSDGGSAIGLRSSAFGSPFSRVSGQAVRSIVAVPRCDFAPNAGRLWGSHSMVSSLGIIKVGKSLPVAAVLH